jgi:hypothetical protein
MGEYAMMIPTRRMLAIASATLLLLGPLSAKGQGQFILPAGPSFNFPGAVVQTGGLLNNPFAAGFGVLGNPSFGFGYGSLLNNGFGLRGGFGLVGSFGGFRGFGFHGGFGRLAALSGLGYGYGATGYGTQWMLNPYQGYLQGAADITRANAQYYSTIQQAKLLRQDAIRSSIQTRRAFLEEAEYERSRMPDPLKLRELSAANELNRARANPPLNDIWSARSLNFLAPASGRQAGRGRQRAARSAQRGCAEPYQLHQRGHARQRGPAA